MNGRYAKRALIPDAKRALILCLISSCEKHEMTTYETHQHCFCAQAGVTKPLGALKGIYLSFMGFICGSAVHAATGVHARRAPEKSPVML